MALATAQKIATPAAASVQPWGRASAPPKRNGSGTTRFLTHWAGRAVVSSAATAVPGTASPAVPAVVAAIALIVTRDGRFPRRNSTARYNPLPLSFGGPSPCRGNAHRGQIRDPREDPRGRDGRHLQGPSPTPGRGPRDQGHAPPDRRRRGDEEALRAGGEDRHEAQAPEYRGGPGLRSRLRRDFLHRHGIHRRRHAGRHHQVDGARPRSRWPSRSPTRRFWRSVTCTGATSSTGTSPPTTSC